MMKDTASGTVFSSSWKGMAKMLVLHRKKGESLIINDNIKITIVDISGEKVKIAIDAPKEIPVLRSELVNAAEANREAAISENKISATDIRNVLGIKKNKSE